MHWEKLTKITGFKFDVGHANFTLKLVMEVADKLLRYKTEIEEICNQAIKEKEIEFLSNSVHITFVCNDILNY